MSSMITCLAWVRRGVAKETPDKVELSKEEIQELLEEAEEKLRESQEQEEASAENINEPDIEQVLKERRKNKGAGDDEDSDDEVVKLYDLDDYDEGKEGEEAEQLAPGLSGLAYYASNEEDPYITLKNQDDEDKDDFIIQKNDNLLVVGAAEEDYSNLEIYVYNEEEDSQYVHHDIILEAFPLALEWLDYDPGMSDKPGNYVAVGSMKPQVEIWDLDIVDTMEPVAVLGGKKKKKSKKKLQGSSEGHTDAVLDLSWNRLVRNVLSSASADYTVRLWDLAQGKTVHILQHHKDKVQSVKFHPYEAQSLLSGGFDKTVNVVDCRNPDTNVKRWVFDGVVEKAIWNHFSPFYFLAGTETGFVYYCDVRSEKPVFTLQAHDDAVSGLALSSQIPGCLVTVSSDKSIKIWDIQENKPSFIMSRTMKMGCLLSVSECPDSATSFAVGGQKQGVKVIDFSQSAPVRSHFEGRQRLSAVSSHVSGSSEPDTSDATLTKTEKYFGDEGDPMEDDDTVVAMKDLSLAATATTAGAGLGKKKKKKRKK